ncbi:MAG: protein kinase [Planctomycetota bacterium]
MGARIGPYEVQGELGRGGMGVVSRALDTKLGRTVALKALPGEVAADPLRLERFEREARLLAQLSHPNLAGIHGVEEHEGSTYLVLEYVEGVTLAERLDRGPLPVDEAIDVAQQIAAGIEAAHEAGVIHRDLKPANVMITPEGRAKVLDFGLARSTEGDATSGTLDARTITSPVEHSPTIPGVIMGTAAYMSPEQARGRRIDRRTDIWSFGVVLYEMLAGAGPFVGETASDSIGAVLHKSIDLDRLPPETPARVRRVIARCLERDKARRYRDIGDARLDLVDDTSAEPESAAADRRSILPLVAVFTAVVLALVAALTFFMLDRPVPQAPQPIHASIVMPEGVRAEQVVVSPDGQRLVIIGRVFETDRPDASFRHVGYVRELSSGEMRPLGMLEDPWFASFSPDGRWVAFMVGSANGIDSDIVRMPADLAGSPTRLCSIDESARLQGRGWFTWTPGNNIAFFDLAAMELVVVSAGTGEEIRRMPVAGDGIDRTLGGFTGPFGDRWVSLGQPIFTEDGYREDVLLIDTASGEATQLIRGAANAVLVGSDRVLFTRGSQIFESGIELAALRIAGEIRPVHDGLAADNAWSDGQFSLSPAGLLAYRPGGVRGTRRTIVQLDLQFNETPWSNEQRAFEADVAASPDMQRVAVVASSPNGLYEVLVADTERRRFRRLLSEPGADFADPLFSPDGETIIATNEGFSSESAGKIFRVPFDGTEPPEVIYECQHGETIFTYGVSPDGEWILAQLRDISLGRSYIEISVAGRAEPREILGLEPGSYDLRYAPAGIPLIAYISTQSGERHLYVRTIEDGKLGTEVRVSDDEVVAAGWHDATIEEGASEAEVSYLGADRGVYTRPVWSDGRIRIGERSKLPESGSRYLDVTTAPGLGGFAIKRGDDEGQITRVDIVTNWLGTLSR